MFPHPTDIRTEAIGLQCALQVRSKEIDQTHDGYRNLGRVGELLRPTDLAHRVGREDFMPYDTHNIEAGLVLQVLVEQIASREGGIIPYQRFKHFVDLVEEGIDVFSMIV